MIANESLLAALDELRTSERPGDARHDRAWRVITQYVYALPPRDNSDAHQETIVRVLRSVTRFEGRTPGEAAAWLRRIHANRRIDEGRAKSRDPIAQGQSSVAQDDDVPDLVDRLAAPEAARDPKALRALDEALFRRIDQALSNEPDRNRRLLRRTEARAAFLRVIFELDADALRTELAPHGAQATNAQIYKWVERGRATLTLMLRSWLEQGDSGLDDALETLVDLMQERRADAGKARPERQAVSRDTSATSGPKDRRSKDRAP